MNRWIVGITAVAILASSAHALFGDEAIPTGVSGNNVVGNYYSSAGEFGFVYNVLNSTYTALPAFAEVRITD